MKYEYCVFLDDIKISRVFQTIAAVSIQLGIYMMAYKEIDPSRWRIACREVSEWHFK